MARREVYEAELPEGVLVLTCGVDTQDDRLEFEVVGHGHFGGESWGGIKKGIIMGRPDNPEVWAQLDDILDRVYYFKSGAGLRISMTFVDEGGHFTQEVRYHCRERLSKKVFAIKGRGGDGVPYTAPHRRNRRLSSKANLLAPAGNILLELMLANKLLWITLECKALGRGIVIILNVMIMVLSISRDFCLNGLCISRKRKTRGNGRKSPPAMRETRLLTVETMLLQHSRLYLLIWMQ